MEEYDELIPHPGKDGSLDLTNRAWRELDSVLWTFGRELLVLNIGYNNIESLPPELGDLMLLRELDCSCNKLKGLPAEIGRCTRLRKLKANGNHITQLPNEMGQCIFLEEVILTENKLRTVPDTLGALQGLKVLRLTNNSLTALPHNLGVVETLEDINCTGNAQLDMIPAPIRGDSVLVKWVLALLHKQDIEVGMLEGLNRRLETRALKVEETKMRLLEDIRRLEEEKKILLRERPARYLSMKKNAIQCRQKVCCAIS